MKFFSFFILLIFPFHVFCQGINMDTIRLNKNLAATLEFSEDVSFSLIGNNPFIMSGDAKNFKYFQISEVGNVIIIEAKEPKLTVSSITVRTKSNVYYGYICYSDQVNKSFYSFSPVVKSEPISKTDTSTTFSKDDVEMFKIVKDTTTPELMLSRINSVLAMKNDFDDIADIKGDVVFQVANIVNDKYYSYIKLIVQNNSASTFCINGVLFKFEEGKKGILNKKDVVNNEWLNAVKIILPPNKCVNSYSFQNIGFVIPLYNGTDGSVLLKVIEENGTRTAVINIKSKVFNTTKIF